MKLKLLSGAHWGPAVPRLIAHAELVLNVLAVDRPPRLGTGCPFCPERPSLHILQSPSQIYINSFSLGFLKLGTFGAEHFFVVRAVLGIVGY